ncbi:MAG: hypothetical protein OXH65_00570 [Paracoccaceae bacterium]|nr:hypothetical protein [Paracoccaceae bacterium]
MRGFPSSRGSSRQSTRPLSMNISRNRAWKEDSLFDLPFAGERQKVLQRMRQDQGGI